MLSASLNKTFLYIDPPLVHHMTKDVSCCVWNLDTDVLTYYISSKLYEKCLLNVGKDFNIGICLLANPKTVYTINMTINIV